jgi:hypothetical protein
MNLEQLNNAELIERFTTLDHLNYVLKDRSAKVMEAFLALNNLPGFQDDTDGSRQTIIDFIRDQEESQPPKNRKRMEGGRRRKSRRRKSRRGKKRRTGRKSRRGRK